MEQLISALINKDLLGYAFAVILVVYVFKKNDEREKRYQETITTLQEALKESLQNNTVITEVKKNVDKIMDKVFKRGDM